MHVCKQLLEQRQADQLESTLGWPLFTEGEDRLGWLMNFTTVRRCQRGLGGWVDIVLVLWVLNCFHRNSERALRAVV